MVNEFLIISKRESEWNMWSLEKETGSALLLIPTFIPRREFIHFGGHPVYIYFKKD